jgi:hypothetical protein
MIETTIIARVRHWLGHEVAEFDGRVVELDPSRAAVLEVTPVAVVGLAQVQPGQLDNQRTATVVVDVHVGRDYWERIDEEPTTAIANLFRKCMQALLRHRGLDDPDNPGTGSPLSGGPNSQFAGMSTIQPDGSVMSGFTITWLYGYTDQDATGT